MGLDIWFRDDVTRILAGHAQHEMRGKDNDYQKGYMDALKDIAVSFGISPTNGRFHCITPVSGESMQPYREIGQDFSCYDIE
jgi:hypothetical protein